MTRQTAEELLRIAEAIYDSDEYCSIYHVSPPAIHVVMEPVYHIAEKNETGQTMLMWQTPNGDIVSPKDQLKSMTNDEIAQLTSAQDIDQMIDILAQTDDETLARMMSKSKIAKGTPVRVTREFVTSPYGIFLTHDEAVADLENPRARHPKGSIVRAFSLHLDSMLARLIQAAITQQGGQ